MLTRLPPPSPQAHPCLPGSSPLPPPSRGGIREVSLWDQPPQAEGASSPHRQSQRQESLGSAVSALRHRTRRVSAEARKRGGQPGNSNAFKHGLYSGHGPHPHAALFRSSHEPLDISALLQAPLPDWITVLSGIWVENRLKLRKIIAITTHNLSLTELCAWSRASIRINGKQVKIFKTLHKLSDPQEHLRYLVRELPVLLNWEFHRFGIPAQPIFVPQELNNFHANLVWEFPRLTAAQ